MCLDLVIFLCVSKVCFFSINPIIVLATKPVCGVKCNFLEESLVVRGSFYAISMYNIIVNKVI